MDRQQAGGRFVLTSHLIVTPKDNKFQHSAKEGAAPTRAGTWAAAPCGSLEPESEGGPSSSQRQVHQATARAALGGGRPQSPRTQLQRWAQNSQVQGPLLSRASRLDTQQDFPSLVVGWNPRQ